MKVLVACEESQTVCKAFRSIGIEAYSCDIIDCSGGHPEWHIKDDAVKIAYDKSYGWDLMIAHPPCTYLSNAGARFLYPGGVLNEHRYNQGLEGKQFFMQLLDAPIKYKCVENPLPSKIYQLPSHSQIVQPYEYGHPFSKRTYLWLKNLPLLKPTHIVEISESTKVAGNWFNKGGKDRQKNRAKTFSGIAEAMANQWGKYLLSKAGKLNDKQDI